VQRDRDDKAAVAWLKARKRDWVGSFSEAVEGGRGQFGKCGLSGSESVRTRC
jgi:hypothetical protein